MNEEAREDWSFVDGMVAEYADELDEDDDDVAAFDMQDRLRRTRGMTGDQKLAKREGMFATTAGVPFFEVIEVELEGAGMSRNASADRPAKSGTARPPKGAAEKTKKPTKPKETVYIVVRPIPSESPTFTALDRVFASRAAARAHADALNRELRLLNPFDGCDADDLLTGSEKALNARVKKLRLPVPKKPGRSVPATPTGKGGGAPTTST